MEFVDYSVVVLYGLCCLMFFGAWRNREVASSGAGFATLLSGMDRRSYNHPVPGGREVKQRDIMRKLALSVFWSNVKTALWAIIIGLALLGTALLFRAFQDVLLNGLSTDLADRFSSQTFELLVAFANAATFDAFSIVGFGADLNRGAIHERLVVFLFLMSSVTIVAETLFGVVRNVLVLICCIAFPLNTMAAADQRITDKTLLQRALHALLELKVPPDPVEALFREA